MIRSVGARMYCGYCVYIDRKNLKKFLRVGGEKFDQDSFVVWRGSALVSTVKDVSNEAERFRAASQRSRATEEGSSP